VQQSRDLIIFADLHYYVQNDKFYVCGNKHSSEI